MCLRLPAGAPRSHSAAARQALASLRWIIGKLGSCKERSSRTRNGSTAGLRWVSFQHTHITNITHNTTGWCLLMNGREEQLQRCRWELQLFSQSRWLFWLSSGSFDFVVGDIALLTNPETILKVKTTQCHLNPLHRRQSATAVYFRVSFERNFPQHVYWWAPDLLRQDCTLYDG